MLAVRSRRGLFKCASLALASTPFLTSLFRTLLTCRDSGVVFHEHMGDGQEEEQSGLKLPSSLPENNGPEASTHMYLLCHGELFVRYIAVHSQAPKVRGSQQDDLRINIYLRYPIIIITAVIPKGERG